MHEKEAGAGPVASVQAGSAGSARVENAESRRAGGAESAKSVQAGTAGSAESSRTGSARAETAERPRAAAAERGEAEAGEGGQGGADCSTGAGGAGSERTWLEADDPAGEARVSFEEELESPEEIKAKREAVKALIAERVREDSRGHALTYEDVLIGLDLDLRYGKIVLAEVLGEMAAEEPYLDIVTITTVTGLVFVYSGSSIPEDEAMAKSVVEEAKYILANAIRYDSLEKVRLTPVGEIYAMAPDADPAIIDVLLIGMPSEPRYADIKKAVAANGAVYYHSDTYLTESYAATLMLAMAGDHLVTIAETIREESRIYPRTTNVAIFRDQQVYGIPAADLDTVLWNLVRKPEYADINRIVHPVTRAIHMYSSTYISDDSAWAMMDWEEVGRANNP